jgi:SynChlorMet cassette protein ScmC
MIAQQRLDRAARPSLSYRLRLVNRMAWHITADEASLPLAEDLCRTLKLKPDAPKPGSPLLLICRSEGAPGGSSLLSALPAAARKHGLPREGWVPEEHGVLRLWFHAERPDVICETVGRPGGELDIIRMQLMLKAVYHSVRQAGGLLLHAALVEHKGAGILLAGRGCAGKSTCCRRLPDTWKMLCDDQMVALPHGPRYVAHPLPTWSEHFAGNTSLSWAIESHLPLAAVFFLEQSPTDAVEPMGQGRAASYVTQLAAEVLRSTWSEPERLNEAALRKGLFQDACIFAKQVPAYQLRVSLEGAFWKEIEQVLHHNAARDVGTKQLTVCTRRHTRERRGQRTSDNGYDKDESTS